MNEVHVRRLSGPPPSHRALAFATRYREALESGKARVVRWETVAGRRAPVLSIAVRQRELLVEAARALKPIR